MIWFVLVLALVGFLAGLSRAFRGALGEPVATGEQPGVLLVQGVVLMVVCGVLLGGAFERVLL